MKITLVGVRENRRTVHWPGVIVAGASLVALSFVGYAMAHFFFALLGGPPQFVPGVLVAIAVPPAFVLGMQLRRAFKTPLDQLPQLRKGSS